MNLTMKDGTKIKLKTLMADEEYYWDNPYFGISFLINDDGEWDCLAECVETYFNREELINWFDIQHKAEKYVAEILEQLNAMKFEDKR